MVALYLVPVILSLLILGAHFLRARNPVLLLAVLAMLALLGWRRRWVALSAQVVLVLGAIVWIFTLAALVERRIAAGEPAGRMAIILGSVALVTALSALVFRTRRLRRWYTGEPPPRDGLQQPPAGASGTGAEVV